MDVKLIGVSRNIEEIRQLLNKVADTDINILIYGETGVGKEDSRKGCHIVCPRPDRLESQQGSKNIEYQLQVLAE